MSKHKIYMLYGQEEVVLVYREGARVSFGQAQKYVEL